MPAERDAVIRLRIDQERARLEAPDTGPAERAFKAEEAAAKEAAKATREVTEAAKELGDAVRQQGEQVRQTYEEMTVAATDWSFKTVRSFTEAGEGALRFGRGLALLSASGSEDLQKLIRVVAVAQGAFDVFAGGAKLFRNLIAVGGTLGAALGGVTLALGAGILKWQQWKAEAEAAADAARDAEKANREFIRSEFDRQTAISAGIRELEVGIGARRTGLATTEAERSRRLEGEAAALRRQLEDAELSAAAPFLPEFRRPIRGTPARQERIRQQRLGLLEAEAPAGSDLRTRIEEETEKTRLATAERLLQIEQELNRLAEQEIRQDPLFSIFGVGEGKLTELQVKAQPVIDGLFDMVEHALRRLQEIENARP